MASSSVWEILSFINWFGLTVGCTLTIMWGNYPWQQQLRHQEGKCKFLSIMFRLLYQNLLQSVSLERIWQHLACVTSVSMWLGSKERQRNGISAFCLCKRWGERQKEERGGGGGRNRLQTNLQFLKTCVRQQTRSLIGRLWLSLALGDLRCVGKKLSKCTHKIA